MSNAGEPHSPAFLPAVAQRLRSRSMLSQYAQRYAAQSRQFIIECLRLPAGWSYAARTTSAAILALYVAYLLQLDSPFSAATTVLIVSNPVRGMIISKSLYRFVGTIIGAIASIVLLALFAQTPVLFFGGFALWLGLCTMVATLIRHFRSYAAVLAGYTVSLVAFTAAQAPDQTFRIVADRISVVSVGIVCSAIVAALAAGSGATNELKKRLLRLSSDLVSYMNASLFHERGVENIVSRHALSGSITQINDLIEFAATESGEIELRRRSLHAALAVLPGTLAEAPFIGGALPAEDRAYLRMDERQLRTPDDIENLRQAVRECIDSRTQEISDTEPGMARRSTSALIRLDGMLDRLLFALDTLKATRRLVPGEFRAQIFHHRDYRAAAKNGIRAALTIAFASTFWVMTAWDTGPMLMAMVGPIISMLATRDRPDLASVDFFKGTVIASIIGFIVAFGVLPQISGFPLLACVLGPVILIGCWFTTWPKYAGIATAFLIFFITLVAPTNPMKFDVSLYLDNAMMAMMGSIFSLVAYQTILPDAPERNVKRLSRAVRKNLAQLIRSRALPDLWSFEQNTHSLLIRLSELTAATPTARPMLDGGISALRIGQEIIWARRAIVETGLVDPDIRARFRELAILDGNPEKAADLAFELAHAIEALTPADPGHKATLSNAARSILEVAEQIRERTSFFTGNLPDKEALNADRN